LDNLKNELGSKEMKILEACYSNRPWQRVGSSTTSKLLAPRLRKKGYERIRRIARSMGIEATVCYCKNPDIPASVCVSYKKREHHPKQLMLFDQSKEKANTNNFVHI